MTLRCPTLRLERHRGVKMHTADSESKNLLVSSCSSCSDKKKCYWWTQLSWGKALRYIKWGSLSLKRWLRGVILTAESKVITLWSNISCTAYWMPWWTFGRPPPGCHEVVLLYYRSTQCGDPELFMRIRIPLFKLIRIRIRLRLRIQILLLGEKFFS